MIEIYVFREFEMSALLQPMIGNRDILSRGIMSQVPLLTNKDMYDTLALA